jgi:hypothetical protein
MATYSSILFLNIQQTFSMQPRFALSGWMSRIIHRSLGNETHVQGSLRTFSRTLPRAFKFQINNSGEVNNERFWTLCFGCEPITRRC